MIKGLAITPPVIGRISIGKVVEKNGKRLPEKDDCFTITTQSQNKDGWVLHPLHQQLLDSSANGKLREIPVTLLFNTSDLNLRADYSLFDRTTGRPVCVGNGETAKAITADGIKEFSCPSPDGCEVGRKGGCKPYGRLNVRIDGQGDELGSFVFRTTGFNSIRTLSARLHYFEAVSGGHTRYLPLLMKLRAKSTTQSRRAPIYYVDLCLRDGVALSAAVALAKDSAAQDELAGVAIEAMETVARQAIANGAFEDGEEDVPAIVEEFFPGSEVSNASSGEHAAGESSADSAQSAIGSSVAERLAQKVPED